MTNDGSRHSLSFVLSRLVGMAAAAGISLAVLTTQAAAQQRDPKAVELAKSVMQAMGGEKA